LNWALAGLARLRQRGRFAPPPSVLLASDLFHQANDLAAQFVAEDCLLDPESREPASRLYQHYVAYCRRVSGRPESPNALAAACDRLGLQRLRVHGRSFWTGARLRPDSQFSETPDSAAPAATAPPPAAPNP